MDISAKLRKEIIPIYSELFANNSFKNICTFAIQWGANFPKKDKQGILFVGKSVNGWVTNDKNVDNLFDKDNPDRIFERSDQMKWVNNLSGNKNGYNTKKSAFWRVIKKITEQYYPSEWYSNIAWTNLYKISPWEGGNPNSELIKKQEKYCIEILKSEINAISPKFVIFLTSGWETVFINSIQREKVNQNILTKKWGKYKTSLIEINKIKYIISHHPQGKKEDEHKNAIILLINSN